MASPVLLRSTDVGAPVLTGENGAGNAVAKWALPQLGWTIEFEDGHRTVFRQGGGPQQYLRLIDDSALHSGGANGMSVAHLKTAEDIDSPQQSPSTGHRFIHKSNGANANVRPWMILGNDQLLYWFIDSGDRNPRQWCVYPIGTGRNFLSGAEGEHFVIPSQSTTSTGATATVAGLQAVTRIAGQTGSSGMLMSESLTNGNPFAPGADTLSGGQGGSNALWPDMPYIFCQPPRLSGGGMIVVLAGCLTIHADTQGWPSESEVYINSPVGLRRCLLTKTNRRLASAVNPDYFAFDLDDWSWWWQ